MLTEKLFEYVENCSAVPMVLYGERGCGKTYVMATVAYKIREKFPMKKMVLAARFVGITPNSFGIRNTLRSICQQVNLDIYVVQVHRKRSGGIF